MLKLVTVTRAAIPVLNSTRLLTFSARTMSSTSLYPAPECLRVPLEVPHKMMMGPGPSNVPPRVAMAGALPVLGHMHPEFFKVMDDVKAGLQYAFQTKNDMTLCVSGTGHAAMETTVCNMLEEGDVVLVTSTGIWGQRFADMAERHAADVRMVEKPYGTVFSLEEIGAALEKHKPSVMFVTHGESSACTLQPLEGIGALCHSHNCVLIVDSVAALGGVPLFVDKWEIDVCYTGSQKVIAAPPGVAPITFSQRARDRLASRKTKVRSWYFDMNELANYWGVEGYGDARRYHHTAPINTIYAIREGLAKVADEGLENLWKRTRTTFDLMLDGFAKLGVKPYVKNEAWRLPTVTGIEIPEGCDWKQLSAYCMKNHLVEISGGLGPSAGKIMRIGLMGFNATPERVNRLLAAMEDGIKYCRSTKTSQM